MEGYRRRPPMEGFSKPGQLGRGEAWDEDDSVEGHSMSDERTDQTEDTEGHVINRRIEDEDTEGHVINRRVEDEDTEGHVINRRVDDDDDTEGHKLNLK